MSLKIGKTELPCGLVLAPMAGVTDRSFRRLCHEKGAEYTVSEMVSAKALCYEQLGKRKNIQDTGTAPLAAITEGEGPMAIQIFGSEPSFMSEAAKMLEKGEYRGCTSNALPIAIDINMGCPMRKIVGNGEGSALMKNIPLAAEICRAVVKSVDIPVTVKLRAGWDKDSINAPELAKALEAAGAAAICVHARTREQLYSPGIDLSVIEKVKGSVSIPVIGNGDITTAADALHMIQKCGCDGVMIGRGAMGNPWIFSEIKAAMEGREYTFPTVEERMNTAIEHLEAMLGHKGERVGLAEGKKHMAWYLTGLRGAAAARNAIMQATSKAEICKILTELVRE